MKGFMIECIGQLFYNLFLPWKLAISLLKAPINLFFFYFLKNSCFTLFNPAFPISI